MLSTNKTFNFADISLSIPIESLEESLQKNPELVNVKGYGGQTALHKSVLIGNHSVVLSLLRYGANPNQPTDTGETSLHIACSRGALKILLALLNYGGDLNIPNSSGYLPLHCAAQNGSIVIVQFLSEVHGCDLEIQDAKGSTVLHGACAGGHLDLVRFLLGYKKLFCLNPDSNGNSVLHNGALSGVSGVCWSILSHGGESLLTTRNKNGQTPSQIADSSLNVSRDCKKWLKIWTQEYEAGKKISSPKVTWLMLFLAPFFIFHSTIILSVLSFPNSQWIIGIPGFIILLCIMRKQQHRISHPARWANPIYLGAYVAGFSSAFVNFLCFYQEHFSVPSLLFGITVILGLFLLYILVYLLKNDPGIIPANEYPKDTLMRVAEERLEGRYCPQCFLSAPATSHHCRLCECCFLQMDHHCLFLNTCIAANNHWHFVVFILLNVISMSSFIVTTILFAPLISSQENLGDWAYAVVAFLLRQDVWTLLLVVCQAFSLAWTLSLLRYQYQVIGTEQTTYCRIKSTVPKGNFPTTKKISNFLKFLYNKKLSLRHSSHYIQA